MEIFIPADLHSTFVILFFVAIAAGLVDAIAGGGGLITVPSMLLLGINPLVALGTNRLQAVIGELTACVAFWLNGSIKLKTLGISLVATIVGALLGSFCVSLLPKQTLQIVLPVLMAAITFYSIFSKRLRQNIASTPLLSSRSFYLLCGLVIGFYNGFFGPGTGAIWMLALVLLLGMMIKQATIQTKPLNFIGNVTSLIFFMGVSSVDYRLGLVMGLGQILGSILGSYLIIKDGDRIVRPVFITVTLLMTLKLLYKNITQFTVG